MVKPEQQAQVVKYCLTAAGTLARDEVAALVRFFDTKGFVACVDALFVQGTVFKTPSSFVVASRVRSPAAGL